MALKYRDMPFRNQPAEGRRLPAFIFAEYGQGDVLLFSHGTFDIWCVYHGIPVETADTSEGIPYPLTLDTVVIESKIPRRLHFKGRLTKHSLGSYNFSAPKDVDYFGDMRRMAETYGAKRVWSSFMRLYNSIPQ